MGTSQPHLADVPFGGMAFVLGGDFRQEIFGDDPSRMKDAVFMVPRAILTPRNVDVDAINDKATDRFPGVEHVYHSAANDSIPDQAQQHLYPMEFLNSLTPSGCPPHQLRLNDGLPNMLLRNLNNARGLANGTRLICRRFFPVAGREGVYTKNVVYKTILR
ncbi:hypothetical protein WJX74_009084 [Apatococcus lobatus]|uniref:DNA helicase Pif1-like 2B domain-containing protein n=1 Tax=Apatococcus lobatus TaxID=904363 RepID=A0AAW1RME8_9CHLO